jgi:hypothetical protein
MFETIAKCWKIPTFYEDIFQTVLIISLLFSVQAIDFRINFRHLRKIAIIFAKTEFCIAPWNFALTFVFPLQSIGLHLWTCSHFQPQL